jgi:hypothetical protein
MNRDLQAADWIAAYLEWQEWSTAAPMTSPPQISPEMSHDALLIAALRAEYDCLHVLRGALDSGASSPRTLQLAFETLDCAQWLLREEQRQPRYHA